ncbi:unnamed protein product [Lactuca virosa]|uniref:DUF7792 domain-containing protein n=1 Tax=Lactuca virosa TaxID=75947 RepID=A0AAU9LZW8_9ASTR|nr:unnamed protein product [Lactuca virosa]
MKDIVKPNVLGVIQLADQIIKEADFACSFKQECADIKTKTENLVPILREVARVSNDPYERPTRLIIDNAEQVLHKTLQLVFKCQANQFLRLFSIIPAKAIAKSSQQIGYIIGDVLWLLCFMNHYVDQERRDEFFWFPPIAANQPQRCLIWENILLLSYGNLDCRANAAATLLAMVHDNERYIRLIMEEGGVQPLLKLAKEDRMKGQESAIRVIRLVNGDPETP